jgi:hypothetical protein
MTYTRDEIMAMSAEQLDVEIYIAKGFDVFPRIIMAPVDVSFTTTVTYAGVHFVYPKYSTDIAAALELVEEAQAEPFFQVFELLRQTVLSPNWHATIGNYRMLGDTAPLAICRAWLMGKQA